MRLLITALIHAFFLAAAAPALADIYGYVDEQGRGHFSNVPLDSRYALFKKESNEPAANGEHYYGGGSGYVRVRPGATAQGAQHNPQDRRRYNRLIATVAQEERMDPALIHAVVTVESGYNAQARSPKGAIGLMQLMPGTAKRYDIGNIWDPLENLRAGARYLRDLLIMFNDNLSLALAAYNAGEGAVMKYGNRIPPYSETRLYVPKVLQHYDRYRSSPL